LAEEQSLKFSVKVVNKQQQAWASAAAGQGGRASLDFHTWYRYSR